MLGEKVKRIWNHNIESYLLLALLTATWMGLGDLMAAIIVVLFIFSLFFKLNISLILKDKVLLALLVVFTINNVISSLLSSDKLISTLLSLLWFLVILMPVAYARFAMYKDSRFFLKIMTPLSILSLLIIVVYMSIIFLITVSVQGLIFRRYSFAFAPMVKTTDTIVMLGGIGYGWFREKRDGKYLWLGFLYLLLGAFGIFLTKDRGGAAAYFVLMIILLSFDYKRLILFFVIIASVIFLSLKIEVLKDVKYLFEYLISRQGFASLRYGHQPETFKRAWLVIKDNWLMGVGTNNVSKFIRKYSYTHNIVLQFWAENGLFGMILGLSIIGLILYRWFKTWKLFKYKYIALGFGVSFIGMLIGNLTNSTIWLVAIMLPFWLIAGVMNALYFTVTNNEYNASGG